MIAVNSQLPSTNSQNSSRLEVDQMKGPSIPRPTVVAWRVAEEELSTCPGRERRTAHEYGVYRDRSAQGVFSSVRARRRWRAAVGGPLAAHGGGRHPVSRAVWRGQSGCH